MQTILRNFAALSVCLMLGACPPSDAFASPQAPGLLDPRCGSVEELLDAVNEIAPIAATAELKQEQATRALKWLDENGVPGDVAQYDGVVMLIHTDDTVGLVFKKRDQGCAAAPLNPAAVPALLKAISGGDDV